MNCSEVAAADLPVRYLAGHLSDAEREAYEGHYFECDACFRELEVLRTAGKVLAEQGTRSGGTRTPAAVPRWLPIAAALLAASTVALWLTSGRGTVPEEARSSPGPGLAASPAPPGENAREAELVRLARFDPPAYDPPRLRNAASRAAFDRAMEDYRRGDFARAVPALEDFLRGNRSHAGAAFYLGVALLATGRADAAVQRLEIARASGDPAYDEEAAFLIAKAQIGRRDLAAAAAALDRVIGLEGERAVEARALRDRLAALDRR